MVELVRVRSFINRATPSSSHIRVGCDGRCVEASEALPAFYTVLAPAPAHAPAPAPYLPSPPSWHEPVSSVSRADSPGAVGAVGAGAPYPQVSKIYLDCFEDDIFHSSSQFR